MANAYRPADERFWEKVNKSETCWLWVGSKSSRRQYGQFSVGNKLVQAHRWAYEQLVGPIPKGMQLDHLCRNPACVNPEHLEPVTSRENTIRGFAARGSDEHCRNGHPRTDENTIHRGDGTRACRVCKRIRERARKGAA